ncbi:MAG: hypothetical protein HY966_00960, partial [Ignavibacteriales bacterium]|nr:hypothetical protein [Ignavibacteriales bacterium]
MSKNPHRRHQTIFVLVMVMGAVMIVAAHLWKSSLRVVHFTVAGNRITEMNEILQL